MKIKMQKITANELIFFCAYFLYLMFALLSTSFYYRYFEGRMYTAVKMLCVFILVVNEIVKSKMTLKSLNGLVICGIIYVVIAYNTSLFNDMALLLAFVYCGRNVSFEKIAKFTIYVSSVILVTIILSAYAGIIKNYVEVSGNRYREYLGFRYSLFPAAIIFNITALVLYLNRGRLKVLHAILLGMSNAFIFYKTNSRLSFYMAVLMILCMLLFQRFPKILEYSRILHSGMSLSFIIAAAVSVILTIKYNENVSWMRIANQVFNNRLKLGNRSLTLYGVSLLGKQNMEWVGNGLDSFGNKSTQTYLWVDNFYISMMQRFGILVFAIIVLLLTFTLFKCLKKRNYYLMFMLTLMAGHCMIDDLFMYLNYNTFWFVIGTVLMAKRIPNSEQMVYRWPHTGRKKVKLKV